jgi:hypothetical protein
MTIPAPSDSSDPSYPLPYSHTHKKIHKGHEEKGVRKMVELEREEGREEEEGHEGEDAPSVGRGYVQKKQ